MKNINDLVKVFGLEQNKPINISSKYTEGVILKYRKIEQDEVFSRTERCGKHFLAAVAFRENANSTFKKTQSKFLPSIGNYYSCFHLSVAMLSLDYATNISQLEKIHHTTLQNLVRANLEIKKLINPSFLQIMKNLQEIRETSNYSVNPYQYDSTGLLAEEMYDNEGIYNLMDNSFNEAINLIHFIVGHANKYQKNFGERIQSFINDSQGDDILNVYFSDEDTISVEKYLEERLYPKLQS